jgi:hypothetical protein
MNTPKRGRPVGDPARRVRRYTLLLTEVQHARLLRYGSTASAAVNAILRTIFDGRQTPEQPAGLQAGKTGD